MIGKYEVEMLSLDTVPPDMISMPDLFFFFFVLCESKHHSLSAVYPTVALTWNPPEIGRLGKLSYPSCVFEAGATGCTAFFIFIFWNINSAMSTAVLHEHWIASTIFGRAETGESERWLHSDSVHSFLKSKLNWFVEVVWNHFHSLYKAVHRL